MKKMKLESICKKCGKRMEPLFSDHVYSGHEGVNSGQKSIMNGPESIVNKKISIRDYSCPYCGYYHRSGIAKEK